ncbi:two-component system response regulator CreB [Solilutibacter silvestris]|uniref:Response regulator consisting of a CheY-like receiver domain and a winged-helix DNA-binding domain n=1 Tax=Solilutibacter silvestris TaxID=1645665 RepID=A0A2K1Q429_9GAMM|nr:two-component system response regulator CreB [Lysobacter silvestris]PNS09784.1 Response regulator consisting of a CheY-like receiver domain and a winged-helix DNA-binding domain [Lysobacter silvestris]
MSKILLVEDEAAIADTLVYALGREGLEVRHVALGRAALEVLAAGGIDLVILDVGLPDMDGFSVCRELRRSSQVPVIFLTARSDEVDRIVGLEIGGDDYVCKPFSPREVATRVKAVLRRTRATGDGADGSAASDGQGDFAHDAAGLRIAYHGVWLDLTRYEYGLLAALLARPGAVLSRAALMDRVWSDALESGDRTVDTHVKTVRAKLAAITPASDPIRTHRGLGYSLDTGQR